MNEEQQNTEEEVNVTEVVNDEHDHDHHDHEDSESLDYTQLNRQELLDELLSLNKSGDIDDVSGKIGGLKRCYDRLFNELRDEALHNFTNEGGQPDDFEYRGDDIHKNFDNTYPAIYEKVKKHKSEQEEVQKSNLNKKRDLVSHLRDVVDGNFEGNAFNEVKKIQSDWKNLGQIPQVEGKELWANYRALMDRFYNNQSIYFELMELDRKKNKEAKESLCEKAEALAESDSIGEALRDLKKLHEEYKHIGPVPKDDQEPLWQRFKKASDSVYDRRKELNEEFKKIQEDNKSKKLEIIEIARPFGEFNTESIKEWNKRTDDLLLIQNTWKEVGPVGEADAKEISKEFWSICKSFFNSKKAFFKKLDAQREENLQKKVELCEKVEGLKENTDFENTAEEIKKIQEEWRSVGQVPRKHNDAIYNRFRQACDEFFDKRREQKKQTESEYEINLKRKEEICSEINKLSDEVEEFNQKIDEYNAIGYVPRNSIKKIARKFEESCKSFIDKQENLSNDDRTRLELNLEFGALKGNPNARKIIGRKKTKVREKIAALNSDISTYNNNIQFFANSKNIDELQKDVDQKVQKAKMEIEKLKDELHLLNSFKG